MSEKPPRFPYVAALLCAACLGAAVWTWMRYSYCWELTPDDLHTFQPRESDLHWTSGPYVRLRGEFSRDDSWQGERLRFVAGPESRCSVVVRRSAEGSYRRKTVFKGRLGCARAYVAQANWVEVAIDTTASRFHGASIAGLVVGAMGVFVFTVALRHWLNHRRASHVETAEPDT